MEERGGGWSMAVRKSRYKPPSERGGKKEKTLPKIPALPLPGIQERREKPGRERTGDKPKPRRPVRPATRPVAGRVGRAKRRARRQELIRRICLFGGIFLSVLAAVILLGYLILGRGRGRQESLPVEENVLSDGNTIDMVSTSTGIDQEPEVPFHPHPTENTRPGNLISYTEIELDVAVLEDESRYQNWGRLSFGEGDAYALADGIFTFRGNNYRNAPTVGTANLSQGGIRQLWEHPTSNLTSLGAYWSGSGWTGQPLMRRWTREEKQPMNMYPWAKESDGLVEVIYACMDGNIYFLDLASGRATRDPMWLGFTFKGAGALDPRGYPIMYLGAGYDSELGTAHAFIISLVDCTVLYTFGEEDEFSLRGSLSYFDSSALVDAETDTLIYPGENGILYLMHLNSSYDPATGALSVNPDRIAKWHYDGVRTDWAEYWLGMEDSAVIYQGYLFIADNGGNLMCLDLNTLQLVWVADVLDDSNSTPVLAVEEGHPFIYISTSFHLGWRADEIASVPIWKIDAETGETVWQTEYDCYSIEDLSGGVLSSPAIDETSLYVTVAMTGSQFGGVLACLDRQTGQVKWEHEAYYSWSSPLCLNDEEGNKRVLYCTSGGMMYLLNSEDGSVVTTYDFGEDNIEASPAAYGSTVVVGTRGCHIYGFELS